MKTDEIWDGIKKFLWFEAAIASIGMLCAAVQFWPGFAIIAFASVLIPLWLTAVAAWCIVISIYEPEGEG